MSWFIMVDTLEELDVVELVLACPYLEVDTLSWLVHIRRLLEVNAWRLSPLLGCLNHDSLGFELVDILETLLHLELILLVEYLEA